MLLTLLTSMLPMQWGNALHKHSETCIKRTPSEPSQVSAYVKSKLSRVKVHDLSLPVRISRT